MSDKQTTLKDKVVIEGVGLHTGAKVTLTFLPAVANHWYKFKRTDVDKQPVIDANAKYVTDTSRGTTLTQNGASVSTVEHVLAALVGTKIDNVLIEINGPEMPILDGSSKPFIDAFEKVGIEVLEADREYLEIPYNIRFEDKENGVDIVAMPFEGYRTTVMVDYNSPVLGTQHANLMSLSGFKTEISSSRTFCFLHELEALYDAGLVRGGNLDNAIVIVDRVLDEKEMNKLAIMFNKPKVKVRKEGILDNLELRYQNEPARHKLLDMIGDLALVGKPIKAQIMAARPGHTSNVAFAKKLQQVMIAEKRKAAGVPDYNPSETPLMDHKEVARLLPHKYPFLLVDKIISKTSEQIVAIKNVTVDQPFFQGHFPGNPIMPGVLQLEVMAQVGGVMILSDKEDPENYSTIFLKIENAKFKRMVVPGDTLIVKMELIEPVRRGLCKMNGKIWVGDKVVCEASMLAQVAKNN